MKNKRFYCIRSCISEHFQRLVEWTLQVGLFLVHH